MSPSGSWAAVLPPPQTLDAEPHATRSGCARNPQDIGVLARRSRAECGRPGHHRLDRNGLLTQFRHDGTGFVPRSSAVAVDEWPPMATISEYVVRPSGMVG
jgi:hypothetical protein